MTKPLERMNPKTVPDRAPPPLPFGRVVTVTAKGHQYLRTQAVRVRLAHLEAAG